MAHKNKAKTAKASAVEVITLYTIVHTQACNQTISQSERTLYHLQTQAI